MTVTQLHHFFVHFPIALMVVAAAADLGGVIARREFFTNMAFWLMGLAALGSVLAAVSGNGAEAALLGHESLNAAVQNELASHVNMGNVLIWVMLLAFIVRLFFLLEKRPLATSGWVFPAINTLLAAAVLYSGFSGGHLTAVIRIFYVGG